jgi:hypothetical protein
MIMGVYLLAVYGLAVYGVRDSVASSAGSRSESTTSGISGRPTGISDVSERDRRAA